MEEQFRYESAEQSYLLKKRTKLQEELDRIIDAIKAGGHIKTLTEEAIKIERQIDEINIKLSKHKKRD